MKLTAKEVITIEKFKDIFYEISDLILGFFVLLIIIATIGYQFYGWFDKDKESVMNINTTIENTNTPSDDNSNKNNAKISIQDIVYFQVKSGESGSQVANNLKDLGLIEEPQDFLTKLKELNLENSVKANTYKLKTESSIDEIISILTK